MPCVALFEEDEMFYRAKLVSFKDNFHMEVGNDLLLTIGVEAKVVLMLLKGYTWAWDPFLESPETFRAHSGWHSFLCIFKTKAFQGTKLCGYFNSSPRYNIWKDHLNRMSKSESQERLFGSVKVSGLSRNGTLGWIWIVNVAFSSAVILMND